MSARTILNPPLNTLLRGSVARSTYIDFIADTPETVEITFPVYYAQNSDVLYNIYVKQLTGCTSELGVWVSNPTTTSTTVSFTVLSTTSASSYCFGVATPY